MQHIPLDPYPKNALAILHLYPPFESESSEDKKSFIVEAVRLEAVVAAEDTEHPAYDAVFNVEWAMVNFDAPAFEARTQLVVQLDDGRLVHLDFVARGVEAVTGRYEP